MLSPTGPDPDRAAPDRTATDPTTPARPGAEAPDAYVPGHGDRSYSCLRYDLDLDYRVETNQLRGRARIGVRTEVAGSRLAFDLANLRVQAVSVTGQRGTRFVRRSGKVVVQLAREVPAGTELTVDIRYAGQPRPLDSVWGEVGWEELTDGAIVASQPSGSPSWFPANDRVDDKAPYTIRITTDSGYHVVANGTLVERRARGGRTAWVFDQPEPMATYLATVQIGRYQPVALAEGPVPQGAAVPARLLDPFHRAFARQPEMMAVFEDLFGRYPFAGYTVVVTDDDLEIPLEAQGLSIFGANHLTGGRTFERLIAHELSHQWFGNCLTVGRWRDVWLHEGFACYAEWLWSERSGGPSADAAARQAWARLRGLPQDLVVADPGPVLMFDDRLYKRGALTLHALRLHLGDDTFFDLLRAWVARRRYRSVTTEELIEHAMRHGDGVLALIDDWIWRRPLPVLPPAGA